MRDERRWSAALAEHERELAAFLHVVARIPPDAWTRAPAPGRWSPAAIVAHVREAYDFGRAAAAGTAAMRLLVPRPTAWLSRTLLLPLLLVLRRFPRGANAPAEVLPDVAAAERIAPGDAAARLRHSAAAAAAALHQAARGHPRRRVQHAYFGALTPRLALRLLSAHTAHHGRGLAARGLGGPPQDR